MNIEEAIDAIEKTGLKVTGPNKPITREEYDKDPFSYNCDRSMFWIFETNYTISYKGYNKTACLLNYLERGLMRDDDFVGSKWTPPGPTSVFYMQITIPELIEFARRVQLKAFW